MLGKALRGLREAAGITVSGLQGYSRVGFQDRPVELGRTGFKPRDVADLCTLYGLTDDAERAALLDLVRAANSAEWWHAYRDVIRPGSRPTSDSSRRPR